MERRKLGGSPLQVPALGLGLMSMSGIYGNANDEESIGVIHHAIDKGITFLDSADMYGWGHNETLLGKALKDGWRAKAIVATKFGQVKLPDGKQGVDGTPGYVMKACEASLKRLGIEVIDLYYQHRVDPNTPIEDTVGAMKRLVEQGKDIVPIPGTKRKERIDENLKALDIRLSADDVKRIADAAPVGAGAGTRYPADGMKRVYL